MKAFKQIILFTIILTINQGIRGQILDYSLEGSFIQQSTYRNDNMNVREYSSSQMSQPFSTALPSNETLDEGLVNPMGSVGLRAGALDNLDDDPNGQGPGIGVRIPVSNGYDILLLLIIAYGLVLYIRIQNKRKLIN